MDFTLNGQFRVVQTRKSTARGFKDLKVGDIVSLSFNPLEVSKAQGSSHRGFHSPTMEINGVTTQITTFQTMVRGGALFANGL